MYIWQNIRMDLDNSARIFTVDGESTALSASEMYRYFPSATPVTLPSTYNE